LTEFGLSPVGRGGGSVSVWHGRKLPKHGGQGFIRRPRKGETVTAKKKLGGEVL